MTIMTTLIIMLMAGKFNPTLSKRSLTVCVFTWLDYMQSAAAANTNKQSESHLGVESAELFALSLSLLLADCSSQIPLQSHKVYPD